MTKRQQSRRRSAPSLWELPKIWLSLHLQSAMNTLGELFRTPLPTGMTIAVIGISLSFPAALYVLTENLHKMAGNWDQTAAISLFLRQDINDSAAAQLVTQLQAWSEIARVQLISREQALAEFYALGGFEDALTKLKTNPLPIVFAIYPHPFFSTPQHLNDLQKKLLGLPAADFARMDTLWLQRFQAILLLIQRGVILLGVLLGLGVLLIVGNTIRLEILNRRIEIEIMELVGATAGFIRRPFLYAGAWYGFLGGLTAWLLVRIAVWFLQEPVAHLASLYLSEFPLSNLGPGAVGIILGSSILFSLVGSWVAVNRHLRSVEPG